MIPSKKLLADIEQLPTLPVSLSRILALAQDERSSMREFEKALEPDPALTATVLRLANSAFFGCSRQVTSVRQAMALLGTDRLIKAATGGVLSRLIPPVLAGYGIDAPNFFRHSVAVAVIGQHMGAELGLGKDEALFTCGLLHDIGKLVVSDYLYRETDAAIRKIREARCAFVEVENELLGLDHAKVGSAMADRWLLPEVVCTVVRHHHEPMESGVIAVDLIHVADGLAHAMGYGADVGELARRIDPGVLARIGAPVRKLEWIVSASVDDIGSLSAAFEKHSGGA